MRILGIDVGTTSVKAVELETVRSRFEIHEYHEQAIGEGVDPMAVVQALILSLPKAPDRIVIGLTSGQVTFRNLMLPTRDKKAIAASVGFELEDDLPFPAEQMLYDYTVLNQAGSATHLHVATTLKRHMEAVLANWNSAGVSPDVITTESWAYRTFFNRKLGTTSGDPVLLAQMGHEKTTLYIHYQGHPVVSREIKWGGRDLTAAIAQKYGVSLEQAASAKHDHGFVLTEAQREQASSEQIEFSDAILGSLQTLLQEIRQAEFSCKSATKKNLKAIYIAGGTSLLPGMARRIEEDLKISARPLQALSSIATSGVTYSEQTDAVFPLATALALCMVGNERNSVISLRKGLFSKIGKSREIDFAMLRKPMMAAGAIALSLFVSVFIQGRVYEKQLQETDAQLERSVRSFFGQLSSSAVRTYMSNTNTLRGSINKELTKQREQVKLMGPNPRSPIAFLREVSSVIPKDATVDLMRFQVGSAPAEPFDPSLSDGAELTFHMASQATADRLSTFLDKKLSDLKKSEVQEVTLPDGSRKFKVTLSGKPVWPGPAL